jgi:hypothetical protein
VRPLSHRIVLLISVTLIFTVIVGLQIAKERVELSRDKEVKILRLQYSGETKSVEPRLDVVHFTPEPVVHPRKLRSYAVGITSINRSRPLRLHDGPKN